MSDSDRELLELAAKACGYKYMNTALWDGREVAEYKWNPLVHDGQALRLAIKCQIGIWFEFGSSAVAEKDGCGYNEDFGDDPDAATRKAVVRAAAEIGRRA